MNLAMSEAATKRIGDYEILGVLGSGGMGKVFKVRNVISDRIEAMKILLPDLAGRQDLADRFLREIKLLAGLNHPNIAALRTALTLNNQLVMVMEYVEGTTLATRLEQGPIHAADAVNYVDQVLGALSYAHSQKVIHRDIKPANMMLTPEGVVKLMDFGIARSGTDRAITTTGTTMGSLYYMSPEQVKGQPTDVRSDLYSLGVSFYELVTGERPFRADSDYSLMAAHLQQPPKPPVELCSNLSPALNQIILMAIAKDPALRFQSADAFRNALNSVKGALPATLPANQSVSAVQGTPSTATALLQNATPAASIHDASTAAMEAPAQPPLIPSVLELSAQRKSHRGLYMSLGALIVLAVLVVAGIYIPRRAKTSANEQANAAQSKSTSSPDSANSSNSASGDASKAQPADSTGSAPQNTDTATPSPTNSINPASGEAQASGTSGDAASGTGNSGMGTDTKQTEQTQQAPDTEKPNKKHTPHKNPKITPATGQGNQDMSVAQGSQAQPVTSAQLEALEEQADQLSSQVSSVNDSLDNLRRQQNAQGLSLRGDIASAQELMKTHMVKAQAALQNGDAASAKKYLDLAEGDVTRLDKFLGR
jgi:eukaryotic-like serine/threonine-protein kinase